uniref:Uncharacterized protein n=1 Tax=Chlorobium chlorochromatii (strain CaD3) TaxID=340177 RepID=Q3AQB4_CHLCH
MESTVRPLGTVMQVLEELGHKVTYAYDDLVFTEHNDFLLQFTNHAPELSLFFNTSCPRQQAEKVEQQLIPAADRVGLSVITKGRYSVTGNEDEENLKIEFFNN